MSKIEVDTIDTQSSTTLQVGDTNTSLIKIGKTGDTVEYPAGTTFTQSGTQNVTAGGAINVKSGGNITIDSGATITNNGTASGFSADLTNLNATNLTSGTVPNARYGTPTFSGANLTNLNATNLASGTVATARLGSGTANSTTFLRGDQTYAAAGGGKILQFVVNNDNTNTSNTSASTYVAATGVDIDITPTSASSKIFIEFNVCVYQTIQSGVYDSSFQYELYRDTTLIYTNGSVQYYYSAEFNANIRQMKYFSRLDTPSTTSAINYNFKFRNPHNGGSIQINQGNMFSDIRAMEVAG